MSPPVETVRIRILAEWNRGATLRGMNTEPELNPEDEDGYEGRNPLVDLIVLRYFETTGGFVSYEYAEAVLEVELARGGEL